jgi:hypothetical protein
MLRTLAINSNKNELNYLLKNLPFHNFHQNTLFIILFLIFLTRLTVKQHLSINFYHHVEILYSHFYFSKTSTQLS